jgi:LacI family transcriptional regulator
VHPVGLEKVVQELEKKEIPIALVGDALALDGKKLCSVQVDAYLSGKMAAEMLHYMTCDDADVIIFVGNKDNSEHKSKIQGFVDGAKDYNLNLVGVYETNDDEVVASQLLKKIISECDILHGIYSATSNSISLCKMIEECGYNTKIISTDINESIAAYIKKGIIQSSIFQDLEKHGRTVVRAVYEYLTEHKIPEKNIYITPQIVIKSNIDTYFTSKENKN